MAKFNPDAYRAHLADVRRRAAFLEEQSQLNRSRNAPEWAEKHAAQAADLRRQETALSGALRIYGKVEKAHGSKVAEEHAAAVIDAFKKASAHSGPAPRAESAPRPGVQSGPAKSAASPMRAAVERAVGTVGAKFPGKNIDPGMKFRDAPAFGSTPRQPGRLERIDAALANANTAIGRADSVLKTAAAERAMRPRGPAAAPNVANTMPAPPDRTPPPLGARPAPPAPPPAAIDHLTRKQKIDRALASIDKAAGVVGNVKREMGAAGVIKTGAVDVARKVAAKGAWFKPDPKPAAPDAPYVAPNMAAPKVLTGEAAAKAIKESEDRIADLERQRSAPSADKDARMRLSLAIGNEQARISTIKKNERLMRLPSGTAADATRAPAAAPPPSSPGASPRSATTPPPIPVEAIRAKPGGKFDHDEQIRIAEKRLEVAKDAAKAARDKHGDNFQRGNVERPVPDDIRHMFMLAKIDNFHPERNAAEDALKRAEAAVEAAHYHKWKAGRVDPGFSKAQANIAAELKQRQASARAVPPLPASTPKAPAAAPPVRKVPIAAAVKHGASIDPVSKRLARNVTVKGAPNAAVHAAAQHAITTGPRGGRFYVTVGGTKFYVRPDGAPSHAQGGRPSRGGGMFGRLFGRR